jgi:tRNA threonylcarbamoyladenosine biosynthesis protein TsaB
MTKILALDSSTDACSVALTIDGDTGYLFELAVKNHTQRLLPMVDEMLRQKNCKLQDLDAIAYGCGPGSFTGLRICMGVVQGLAFGANLPVLPVSTLQAMACGFMAQHPHNTLPILAALDARMDEIYWGLFGAQKFPQALEGEAVMKPALVCEQPKIVALQKNFIALGSGWQYAALQTIAPQTLVLEAHPSAQDIALLAVDMLHRNEQIAVLNAEPVYLRNSISWQKRQPIRRVPITLP